MGKKREMTKGGKKDALTAGRRVVKGSALRRNQMKADGYINTFWSTLLARKIYSPTFTLLTNRH